MLETDPSLSNHEHILVCLSPSPTNAKIIQTAAKMAEAFHGSFTALYVQTPLLDKMDDKNKKRLHYHMSLAEQLGATIATVNGDDIPYQIAEFARLSEVTKIVIGRSNVTRRHFWNKSTITEKLTAIATNMDIHIIPDIAAESNYYERNESVTSRIIPTIWDLLITFAILIIATAIGSIFSKLGFTEANIITVYILGVLVTSLFTKSYACSVIGSLMSVLLFNFFFTEPRLTFHAYQSGYPFTFAIMLIASIITGTLANRLKNSAKQSAQSAFRTKVLFDTNQLLQRAQDDNDIINITASQLMKLLDRNIIAYLEKNQSLSRSYLFLVIPDNNESIFTSNKEKDVANWVLENKERAGASTDHFSDVLCLYLPISIKNKVYGVIGIHIDDQPLDSFEYSVLLSILGECALAIENNHNAKEKEMAAVLAKNEQLRANLLRAISHDLRTPLTSISGNASNLLSNYDKLDSNTRLQVFTDIYDDSMWLISLVENLLSITRVEEGNMNFNQTVEIIDDVIEEALRHINPKSVEHHIDVDIQDDFMLAKMDAKLIIQVIINIVDNAIKYTPANSTITITAKKQEKEMLVNIKDDGEGIPDSLKPKVFEMFFTGEHKIADSRRSLGLGLSLCKSIIHAHGGSIDLKDNEPHGCNFFFTLPLDEVNINE